MPRPRAYVNECRRPVSTPTGVSHIPSQGRFYIIDAGKQRRYFRRWADARAAYIAIEQSRMTQEQRAIMSARVTVRTAAVRDKLIAEGRQSGADDLLFAEVADHPPLGRDVVPGLTQGLD